MRKERRVGWRRGGKEKDKKERRLGWVGKRVKESERLRVRGREKERKIIHKSE